MATKTATNPDNVTHVRYGKPHIRNVNRSGALRRTRAPNTNCEAQITKNNTNRIAPMEATKNPNT